jgi:transposase
MITLSGFHATIRSKVERAGFLLAAQEGQGQIYGHPAVGVHRAGQPYQPPGRADQEDARHHPGRGAHVGKEVDRQKLMPPRGLVVLPRRWVVERTFSWLSQNRRMSEDYERLCATAEAFVYVAMTRLMVRRLVRA